MHTKIVHQEFEATETSFFCRVHNRMWGNGAYSTRMTHFTSGNAVLCSLHIKIILLPFYVSKIHASACFKIPPYNCRKRHFYFPISVLYSVLFQGEKSMVLLLCDFMMFLFDVFNMIFFDFM